MNLYTEILPIFITVLYGDPFCLGASSLVSVNASQLSLEPSFTTAYGTVLATLGSTVSKIKSDDSSSEKAVVKAISSEAENLNDYTGIKDLMVMSPVRTLCPSTQKGSAFNSLHNLKKATTLNTLKSSKNLNYVSFIHTSIDRSFSKGSWINPNSISSIHIRITEAKSANSSKDSSANEKSHIFALVFGIFGGFLVLGIGVLIIRNLYTKSRNRVKKIKKKRGRKV